MAGTADTTSARTLTRPDGPVVGFAQHGDPGGRPVLWCHGGPVSRLEPAAFFPAAAVVAVRIVGVDRPGWSRTGATSASCPSSSPPSGRWADRAADR